MESWDIPISARSVKPSVSATTARKRFPARRRVMPFKHQTTVSPFKRIRLARGLTQMEVSVLSGVAYNTVRKIDRMDPKMVGGIGVGKVMRIAMLLECAPSDLLPFLNVRCKAPKSMKGVTDAMVARKKV
jgi:DNA-binding Xre family transcriptional regulator